MMGRRKIYEKISGVYRIFSKTFPDMCYIGASHNVYARRNNHINSKRASKILDHIKIFGKDDLAFEILKRCDDEQLEFWEAYFIGELNPVWNTFKKFGKNYKHGREARNQARFDICEQNNQYYCGWNLFDIEKRLFEISNTIAKNTFNINFEDLTYNELMKSDII